MTSLRNELELQRVVVVKCRVGLLLDGLPVDVAGELDELLDDPSVKTFELINLFRKKGWAVGASTLTRHRLKQCKC